MWFVMFCNVLTTVDSGALIQNFNTWDAFRLAWWWGYPALFWRASSQFRIIFLPTTICSFFFPSFVHRCRVVRCRYAALGSARCGTCVSSLFTTRVWFPLIFLCPFPSSCDAWKWSRFFTAIAVTSMTPSEIISKESLSNTSSESYFLSKEPLDAQEIVECISHSRFSVKICHFSCFWKSLSSTKRNSTRNTNLNFLWSSAPAALQTSRETYFRFSASKN